MLFAIPMATGVINMATALLVINSVRIIEVRNKTAITAIGELFNMEILLMKCENVSVIPAFSIALPQENNAPIIKYKDQFTDLIISFSFMIFEK